MSTSTARPLLLLIPLMLLIALASCGRTAPTPDPTATPSPAIATEVAAAVEPVASDTPTATPSPTATATPSPVPATATAIPTDTFTPTATPTATASATPPAAFAVIVRNPVNLRGGPGQRFDVVGQVISGQRYPVLARNASGNWWQIEVDGLAGWVFGDLVDIEGDAEALAVVEAPVEPTALPPVQVYETTIDIPTYPYAAFTEDAVDEDYSWTYQRFDRDAYQASSPRPYPWSYRAVVLENEYLRITLLPDLGGRIYSVVFKPTGSNELYQNPVIKPSPWGPVEQGGWLAAGGIEWDLPVAEHGYAWSDSWGYITNRIDPSTASVTVFMPFEEHLRAEVDVTLHSGEAAFTIQPRIVNPTDQAVDYQFWINALLAPGPANTAGPGLRFLFPTDQMTVHSRGDESLPEPQNALSWPVYDGTDYSLLGNWSEWLGVFERPAAHGPFTGVYDGDVDEGMVRVFSPAAAPGSKGFGLGWSDPLDPTLYTDGRSAYVELHAGVAPTFWDQARLAAGETYTWQETWFPVAGIGGVSTADGNGAVYLAPAADGLTVGIFPRQAVTGRVVLTVDDAEVLAQDVTLSPAEPLRQVVPTPSLASGQHAAVTLFDQGGTAVLHYELTLP
ncbi:MAG: DUF5107 domain-containing protein [Anaerolineae bacterium]|nr:DUF5107 domain-containing protein [Anaerolineae bacterium]